MMLTSLNSPKNIDFPSLFSPVLRSCLCLHFFLFFLLLKFEKKRKMWRERTNFVPKNCFPAKIVFFEHKTSLNFKNVEQAPPPSSTQQHFFEILINRSLLLYNNQSFIVSSQISAQTMASPPRQVGVYIAELLARILDSSAEPEPSSFEEFQFGNFPLA